MVKEITLRQAGGSVTATLPKEMAERLQVGPGDRMFAIETENGVPTIRARFDTYRFADYKEKVVDLLARVTRVSVETVRITEAMRGAAR